MVHPFHMMKHAEKFYLREWNTSSEKFTLYFLLYKPEKSENNTLTSFAIHCTYNHLFTSHTMLYSSAFYPGP